MRPNDIPGDEREIDSFSGKTETPNPNELVGQTTRFGWKTRPPKYLDDVQLKICFSGDI